MLELRQLERNGDVEGAIRRGEALLHDFPDNRRVEDALVNLYRAAHHDEGLAKLLRRRAERDPNDLDATRELATQYLSHNNVTQAQEVLRRAQAANPRDENRYRMSAGLLRSRGLLEPAIQAYREGRQAIGVETLFAAELAQLEEERGDYGAAIGEYLLLLAEPERQGRARHEIAKLLERAPDPGQVLQRVAELRKTHPRSPAVQDVAATAFLQAGRLEEALAAIREADRCANDQGEYLLDFGRAVLDHAPDSSPTADRARVGVAVLTLLSERHPESNLIPEAAKLTAEGLVSVARGMPAGEPRQKLLEQAVTALDAFKGKPRWAGLEGEALALKAMILFEDLGKPAEALGVFEKLAASQPDSGEERAHLLRVQVALCHAAMGQLDEARKILQAVASDGDVDTSKWPPGLEKPKSPPDLGRDRARFHLAQLDFIGGDYEKARTTFAALAEEAPEDRLANDCLDIALTLNESAGEDSALARLGAYYRAQLGRDRDAEKRELDALGREHAQSSLAAKALFELAGMLAEEQHWDEARLRYDQVVNEHAKHRLAARALEAIGDLQVQHLSRADLAVATYERILTEYPDDLFLDGVRKKLVSARSAAKGVPHATP